MKTTQVKSANKGYVVALSLTLFLCPLLVVGLSRWATEESWNLAFNDYFCLSSYWIAAGLVWFRYKFAWLISLSLLAWVVVVNLISMFAYLPSDMGPLYITQFLLSVGAISFVALMVDFLNHKFLDRRDQFSILGAAHRYEVSEAAQLRARGKLPISGIIKSLSFSGAVIEMDMPEDFSGKKWTIDIPQFSYINQPVEVVEVSAQHLRLHFLSVNPVVMWRLRQQLKALK